MLIEMIADSDCNGTFELSFSVEALLSLLFVGLIAGFPVGPLIQWKGPRCGAALALPLSTISYLLIWSATLNAEFYYDRFYLLVLYFLFAGNSSNY